MNMWNYFIKNNNEENDANQMQAQKEHKNTKTFCYI